MNRISPAGHLLKASGNKQLRRTKVFKTHYHHYSAFFLFIVVHLIIMQTFKILFFIVYKWLNSVWTVSVSELVKKQTEEKTCKE